MGDAKPRVFTIAEKWATWGASEVLDGLSSDRHAHAMPGGTEADK
jgi:hypothetical protein